jgi:SAM-dependent methyltransferase
MLEAEAYSRLAGVYDEIVVDPCFAEWAHFLDELWRTDPAGVRRVLDVCCGTGLLAAELLPRGYAIVGVDAAEAMLARARRLLGPEVPLVRALLPDLPVTGTFDAAVSTFDGLNYLTPPDLRATLAAVAAHLRPHGWLAFDLHTDAMLAFTVENPVVTGEDRGLRFVITSDIDPVTRVCDTRIELTGDPDTEPFAERHVQYFHSDDDVRAALAAAGFERVVVLDEYTPAPAGASTLRATWVARRAAE